MKNKLLIAGLLFSSGCNQSPYEIGDRPIKFHQYEVGTSKIRLYLERDGTHRLEENKDNNSNVIYYDHDRDDFLDRAIVIKGNSKREYTKGSKSRLVQFQLLQQDFSVLMKGLRIKVLEDSFK